MYSGAQCDRSSRDASLTCPQLFMQSWALIQLCRNSVSPCICMFQGIVHSIMQLLIKLDEENKDPKRICHFVTSINNTNKADKIAKQVWYAPRSLQDAFERALNLEAFLQLTKCVHLGRSPELMQVFTGVSYHQDMLKGCIHQANFRDSWARSNACWKYGRLGHFQKDCKANLNSQGGDRDDLALSDINPTIGKMSHALTTSTPITDLTFKAVLKELVSLAIGNRRAFCAKPQNGPKTISQPTARGVSPTVTPVLTSVTSASLSQTMFWPTQPTISSASTSLPVNPGRGPPVSQGARFKVNRHVTSQAVVQLLDFLDEFTEELQCKENIEEVDSMEKVHKIIKEFQEFPQWMMKCYQPEVYYINEIEEMRKEEFVEVITLSLTGWAAFPVTIMGVICNPLLMQVLQEAL